MNLRILHMFEGTFSFYIYHSMVIFGKQQINDIYLFSMKTGLDILCKLSPLETICMKCQNLFPGKNKEIFQNVVC